MSKKKEKGPHADCPPAVWDGIQWVCNNHGQPQVIERTREAVPTAARPGAKAPVPRPVDTELHSEVAALRVKLAANTDALAVVIGDLEKLRATVAALPAAKAPKAKAG